MTKMTQVSATYIYVANHDSPKHRGKHSAYIVETMSEGKVVARIIPLKNVNSVAAAEEATIQAMMSNIFVTGKWAKLGKHHQRIETSRAGDSLTHSDKRKC